MGDIQLVKVDVPQPACLAGEILPGHSVHDDEHRAILVGGSDIAEVRVIGDGIFVLGGQERAVVLTKGEGLHPSVFQNVAAEGVRNGGSLHAAFPAGGIGRQNVIHIVNAAEGQCHGELPVQDQFAVLQVQLRGGVVRVGPGVAAAGAAVRADVVVVDVLIFHGRVAHWAVGPVMIDPGGGLRIRGTAIQPEPLHFFMANGKAAGQGIVAVQDQLRIGVDGGENGVKHAFGVTVPGELVPVQVGDDKFRGVEILEAVGSVPLVAFQQQHVCVDLPPQGGVGQDQCGDALYLIGALGVVNDVLALGTQDGGDHLHGGGLAVGAGDGDDVGRQLYPSQNVRADLQGELAGHRAALAHQLAYKSAQLADHDC